MRIQRQALGKKPVLVGSVAEILVGTGLEQDGDSGRERHESWNTGPVAGVRGIGQCGFKEDTVNYASLVVPLRHEFVTS